MPDKVLVIGSSGHAKVVIDVIEREGRFEIAGLIDSFKPAGEVVCGYRVLGSEEAIPGVLAALRCSGAIVAIGDNAGRGSVVERIASIAPMLPFATAVHPSAQLGKGVSLGDGTVVMAGVVVNADSTVGRHCILNTKSSLDHDSVMEDFSSLAPGATTGGRVRIGAFTAVSLGASILQGMTIGTHTLIGAGALVRTDVPGFRVAYGVPARIVRTRAAGEKYL